MQLVVGMDLLDVDFSYFNPQFILMLVISATFMYSDIELAVLANNIGEFAYKSPCSVLDSKGWRSSKPICSERCNFSRTTKEGAEETISGSKQ